jgi:hypothetical protein
MTMTLVSTVTVGSGGAASIDFNSIPATGTDLLVLFSARNSSTADAFRIVLNSDTTNTNYSSRNLYGRGTSSPGSGAELNSRFMGQTNISSNTANTFSNQSIYFTNYTSTAAKSFSSDWSWEDNAGYNFMAIAAHLYLGTSAITSISFTPNANLFAQNSIASLYIVTKGSGGATTSP